MYVENQASKAQNVCFSQSISSLFHLLEHKTRHNGSGYFMKMSIPTWFHHIFSKNLVCLCEIEMPVAPLCPDETFNEF